MPILLSLLAKFAQPSSWAGLSGVLALCGVNVSAGTLATIIQVGAGVCGLIAIVINERGHAASRVLIAFMVPAGLAVTLGGCNPAVSADQAKISTAIETACTDVTSAAALAAPFAAGSPSLASVLTFATASCGSADAVAALATKAVNDPTTVAWAENLAAELKAALPAKA